MQIYKVKGMHCKACQIAVEKAVQNMKQVQSCKVSLLTNEIMVDGEVTFQDLQKVLAKIGYQLLKVNNTKLDQEDKKELYKFISSLVLLIILMYFSMGYMMFNLPVPLFLKNNFFLIGLIQAIISLLIMIINFVLFKSGLLALCHKTANMDTLIALGAGISYIWSLFVLSKISFLPFSKQMFLAHHQYYFESAAMILVFVSLGKLLETYTKGKTLSALNSLLKLMPTKACLISKEKEKIVDIEEIKLNDIVLVKAGEKIPIDGIVIDGKGVVDESLLTGESLPVERFIGGVVKAATILQDGYLKIKATKVGEDTVFAKIIHLVSDISLTKMKIEKTVDRIAAIFIPCIIFLALSVLIIWLCLNVQVNLAIQHAIAVLVVACPCSLGLATPVAIMVGSGVGFRHGLLFKKAQDLEELGKIDIFVFDKTGTLTKGKMEVVDTDINDTELWQVAYSLESKSSHPLAKAIVKKAKELKISSIEINNFKNIVGKGLQANIDDKQVWAGSLSYIEDKIHLSSTLIAKIKEQSKRGRTGILFAKDKQYLGTIFLADQVKEESKEVVKLLKEAGKDVIMLTGDQLETANFIAREIGINKVFAQVLPADKEKIIRNLSLHAKVAMIGDGINDAPSLARANIGIAIGRGMDIAIEAADIVIQRSNLKDIIKAIMLSKATLRIIYQNLFWALIYNLTLIPLASGLIPHVNIEPMLAALAMSLSSITVVLNALRLNNITLAKKKIK